MKKSQRGFTLIELLVVIGIIGILAALVLVALGNARTRAQDTRIRSGLSQLRLLAESHFDSNNANYHNFGGCVTGQTDAAGPVAANCVTGMEEQVHPLVNDINDASPANITAVTDANDAGVFCIAAQLRSPTTVTWLRINQTGAFEEVEQAATPCT